MMEFTRILIMWLALRMSLLRIGQLIYYRSATYWHYYIIVFFNRSNESDPGKTVGKVNVTFLAFIS